MASLQLDRASWLEMWKSSRTVLMSVCLSCRGKQALDPGQPRMQCGILLEQKKGAGWEAGVPVHVAR